MTDLQDIYGIDAKTLAGISKGRLPRKLLASGKLKGDGYGKGGQSDGNYQTEMSFRSTQNTFQNKLSTANKMKQSINDAQSNMFSMNGFTATNHNWNQQMQSNLNRGHPSMRDSRHEAISQFDKRSQANKGKGPLGKGKMTSTQ